METMLSFAGLVIFTLAAGALAVLMDWLLLRAAFRMMRPMQLLRPMQPVGRAQSPR